MTNNQKMILILAIGAVSLTVAGAMCKTVTKLVSTITQG